MRTSWIDDAERLVLERLNAYNGNAVRITDLIESIESTEFTSTELRIAALNLVSRGLAKVNNRWEIVAVPTESAVAA